MQKQIKLYRAQLAASEIPDIYTQVDWSSPKYIQPKLDGICCLAVNGVAYSRTMKPIPNKSIQKTFKELNLHGFHGELMYSTDFNATQSFVMSEDKVDCDWYYVVYDYWDSAKPYLDRLLFVQDNLPACYQTQLITNVTINSAKECEFWMDNFVGQGYEGAMLRDPNSLYKQGRHTLKSQALMKLKKFFDDEAVIIGFEEKLTNTNEQEKDERGYSKRSHKKGGMVGADALGSLVVKWKDKEFGVGSGFDDKMRKYIWNNRDTLINKQITFKYQELSKYGVPRFPVFKAFYYEV